MISERIRLMSALGEWLQSDPHELIPAKALAGRENGWFIPEYIDLAIHNICESYLSEYKLKQWIEAYPKIKNEQNDRGKTIGIVMAGNIPLVGFHDFLCAYISGLKIMLKLSSKDQALWKMILARLREWDPSFATQVQIQERLKDCDAYIATGSNNTALSFEYYFAKYPHIIRKNRTSVAILDGHETDEDLKGLAADVCTYFGLGCRNITKIYVPEHYGFETLLPYFDAYKQHFDFHKYRNNYDFQLSLLLLNKKYYMTNGSILLTEHESLFAPLSVLNFEYYPSLHALTDKLAPQIQDEVQLIETGARLPDADCRFIQSKLKITPVPMGQSQKPTLADYADGVDTMKFIETL